VETAMLAAATGLAYFLSNSFRIEVWNHVCSPLLCIDFVGVIVCLNLHMRM
jgi:hypothetical protein